MAVQELYDLDFFEWTQRNAELLSRGYFDAADIPHIAEELADLGRRDQREVRNFLTRLIMHLLKWQFQPSHRGESWLKNIIDSRENLDSIFEQSPSLRRHAKGSLARAYGRACKYASVETGLEKSTFPPDCPYSFDQMLNDDFLPEN
jgi:hypothetical protein